MLALFLLFVVTPFVELFLLVRVGRVMGVLPTLVFVIVMGLLGAVLAKSQGRKVITEWQTAMSQGRVPAEGVLGGILVLLGALLLITPGFLTDFLGLLLMVAPFRKRMAQALGGYLGRQMAAGKLRVKVAHSASAPPTEVGRAAYRPGDVIDTQGEEID